MSSYSQTKMVYKTKNAGKVHYIDLSQGLALLNGKNCSQFAKDKPLNFMGTIRGNSSSQTVRAAKNSWVVRNACVKLGAAWKRTLRSASIRSKKQLNTYGREMRLALDSNMTKNWGGADVGTATHYSIVPQDVPNSYKTGQYTDSGDEVTVYAYATWGAGDAGDIDFSEPFNQHAFTQTVAAVPKSGSTDVNDKPMELLGDGSGSGLSAVYEYLDSRINEVPVEDLDLDPTPSHDNDLIMMMAPGEEVADDVLDNVDDEGKWRPYAYETHQTAVDVLTKNANVAGQATGFVAPLGLLEWVPESATDMLVIDVQGISEM